jgi:hypothetical protein
VPEELVASAAGGSLILMMHVREGADFLWKLLRRCPSLVKTL